MNSFTHQSIVENRGYELYTRPTESSLIPGCSSSPSARESTPPLSTDLSAGRRPTQVCGNDTARAAEIFLHFSPSRSQTGWHWLESGAARQGQSMRIDRAVRLRLQSWKISRQLKRGRERERECERDRKRRGWSTNSVSSQPTSLQTNMLWLS